MRPVNLRHVVAKVGDAINDKPALTRARASTNEPLCASHAGFATGSVPIGDM